MNHKEDEQKTFEEFAAVSTNKTADIHKALNVWRGMHGLPEQCYDTVRKRVSAYRKSNGMAQSHKNAWTPSELETVQLLVDEAIPARDAYNAFKKVHPASVHPEVGVYDRFVRIRRGSKPVSTVQTAKPSAPPSVTEMLQHAKLVTVATEMRKVFVEGMARQATDANYKAALDLCAYMTGLER